MAKNLRGYILGLLVLSSPLAAQYSFDLAYFSDSIVVAKDIMEFYLRLTNTGSAPDSYEIDCRVIDSVPNWFVSYCAFGQCTMAGNKLKGYIGAGAFDTVHIQVFPSTDSGMAVINLHARSIMGSTQADSLNVYAVYGTPGQYGFDFSCLDDTIKIDTAVVEFQFRIENTGTSPDTYAFTLQVFDSIPGWLESFYVNGQWTGPGQQLTEYVGVWAVDTAIHVRIDPATQSDTEKLNFSVWSKISPWIRDSVNIYVVGNAPAVEEGGQRIGIVPPPRITPNPFRDRVDIICTAERPQEGVVLEIYDVAGRVVRQYAQPMTGRSSVICFGWDGRDDAGRSLPAGVYVLEIISGNSIMTSKAVLLR
jgi:hypothetical protein